LAGGNGKKSMKSRKRAAQVKAAELQKAAAKKARFSRNGPARSPAPPSE
jgi:hypothetical protein